MSALDILDQYVSPEIRSLIEQRYYAKINAQARLDYFINDPEFLRNPDEHVALYPDHGVAHVRDVARQILRVLDNVHGVLIPARSASRFQFMRALAVMVSYAHDIGMMDYSRFGRAMHAEFAIPKEVFFKHWHHTLSPAELIMWMTRKQTQVSMLNHVMEAQL